jgi:hypothetical protein
MEETLLVTDGVFGSQIYLVRGGRVMLDTDMAMMYSEPAIEVNITSMRLLVRMNRLLMSDRERMHRSERSEWLQDQVDMAFIDLLDALELMMEKPLGERKRLGCRGGDPV